MAASKQAHTLTHFRDAVPLVWGLLRLAPIISLASQLASASGISDTNLKL